MLANLYAWAAGRTLEFWLKAAAVLVLTTILVAPSCMYMKVKGDLRDAKATIAGYELVAKGQRERMKIEIEKIKYTDRIIEKKVVETKLKRELIYVENKEAADWACTFVPDAAIWLQDGPPNFGQGSSGAAALPDYCRSTGREGQTAD